MEKCVCTQCGSVDFDKEGANFLRCRHCLTLFRMLSQQPESGPKLIINKGANVVFGKGSNVVVKGGMQINEGANVEFLGHLEVIEKSSPEQIEKAKQHLKSMEEQN